MNGKMHSETSAFSSDDMRAEILNPFVHKLELDNTYDKIKTAIFTVILLPFRVIVICYLIVTAWFLACIGLYGLSEEDLRKKPMTGWRRKRRTQDINVGNDNAKKENTPANTMEIPINEIEVGLDSKSDRKTYTIMQNVELLQVQPEDTEPSLNTCSDNISSEKLSPNALQINTPCDIHDMNESDDSIDWYEISGAAEVERDFSVEGRRIVDFDYLFKRLQEISNHNKAFGCTLQNVRIVAEKRNGLLSKYTLFCNMCNLKCYLDSEPKTTLNLNKAAMSAVISTGICFSQFSEICAAMDCPSFSQANYSKVQNEVNDDWRNTAVTVMEEAAERERNAAIAEGRLKNGFACIDVIADGVWSKYGLDAINK